MDSCLFTIIVMGVCHLYQQSGGVDVCRCVLVEEEVDSYKEDLVLARFNQQMEPFYSLLRDVESVRLAPDSVEPYPADIPHLRRF